MNDYLGLDHAGQDQRPAAGAGNGDVADKIAGVDAPVVISEIAAATGISNQAVLNRARNGSFGCSLVPGRHIYDLKSFADAGTRAKILTQRRRKAASAARARLRIVPARNSFPIKEAEFTENELAIGRERRDFVLEVERMQLTEPSLSQRKRCEKIAAREIQTAYRQGSSLRYEKLVTGGHKRKSELSFGNYRRWRALWDPWRRGRFDSRNWHCLCPRRRFCRIDEPDGGVGFVLRDPSADEARFWALFCSFYGSASKHSRQQAYDLAKAAAEKAGIPPGSIPQLYRVGYPFKPKAVDLRVNHASEDRKRLEPLRQFWDAILPEPRMWIMRDLFNVEDFEELGQFDDDQLQDVLNTLARLATEYPRKGSSLFVVAKIAHSGPKALPMVHGETAQKQPCNETAFKENTEPGKEPAQI